MHNPFTIACAVTGGIHTPTRLPCPATTTGEISQSAIGAAERGAAASQRLVRLTNTGGRITVPKPSSSRNPALDGRVNMNFRLPGGYE